MVREELACRRESQRTRLLYAVIVKSLRMSAGSSIKLQCALVLFSSLMILVRYSVYKIFRALNFRMLSFVRKYPKQRRDPVKLYMCLQGIHNLRKLYIKHCILTLKISQTMIYMHIHYCSSSTHLRLRAIERLCEPSG